MVRGVQRRVAAANRFGDLRGIHLLRCGEWCQLHSGEGGAARAGGRVGLRQVDPGAEPDGRPQRAGPDRQRPSAGERHRHSRTVPPILVNQCYLFETDYILGDL